MKITSIILLIFMQLCTNPKNNEEVFPKQDTIVGKWQLFETCISPGAGCELKKITNGLIIEFKADGTYLVSNVGENEGLYQCDGKWKILEIQTLPVQQRLELSPNCNKAIWTLAYSFNENNTLNINPQCIEECRYTYKPI